MTHFATADDDPEFTSRAARARSRRSSARCASGWPGIVVHAANSAATLREPASHFDLVRCGIAIYGCDPMNEDPGRARARAGARADARTSRPSSSRAPATAPATAGGSSPTRDTWIATVPIGYADGIRRALTNNCDVLIGGRRYPLVGTVSMDNITVDSRLRGRQRRAAASGRRSSASTAPSARRPRSSRAGSARSTTRSCAGSRRGCRGPTTATGSRCEPRRSAARARRAGRGRTRVARRRRGPRPAARAADRRLRRRGRTAMRAGWPARSPGRRTATRSRCRRRSASGASSPAITAGRSTCCRSRANDRGRPRAARLHDQRDRRAARRRRPCRSVRRPRGPARPPAADGRPRTRSRDDPLRALRLARLACELGFDVERGDGRGGPGERRRARSGGARAGVRRAQADRSPPTARSPGWS